MEYYINLLPVELTHEITYLLIGTKELYNFIFTFKLDNDVYFRELSVRLNSSLKKFPISTEVYRRKISWIRVYENLIDNLRKITTNEANDLLILEICNWDQDKDNIELLSEVYYKLWLVAGGNHGINMSKLPLMLLLYQDIIERIEKRQKERVEQLKKTCKCHEFTSYLTDAEGYVIRITDYLVIYAQWYDATEFCYIAGHVSPEIKAVIRKKGYMIE